MHTVQVIAVNTEEEKELFFSLPWKIYTQDTPWVPPLQKDERRLLSPSEHPFWESATRQLFLALRGTEAVGRIVALVDNKYNDTAQEKCGAWGFFECQNDTEAAHALFDAVAAWHSEQGMHFMRGPLNPSTNYTCAMLVGGFEQAPAIMMPWNYAYYPQLVESWGMRKEQDLFAYALNKESINLAPWLKEQIQSIKDKQEFTCRKSSKATLQEDIHCMLDIFQESWAQNWAFSPMSMAEAQNHAKELKNVLDLDFFVLFYHEGKPAAGMLAVPDMNPLLKRLNGRIGLSAPWHWWCTRKHLRSTYRIMLFGIKEKYRLMGLPLLLLDYMLEQCKKHPYFTSVEGSWSLEDNVAVNDMMEDFGGVMTKRYRIYRKELKNLCL